ncbi:MAG TPA: 3-hydroxybutyrate dehydrogenase [Stellaceae bacterium]|nr:3-hydroxybutyrate dehydrogenase [Stellaceae bacterium]
MSLKGKVAVVTGSTSGIGLGVARALATEGCAIMLNGFGDQAMIDKLRQDLAQQHGAKTSYNGADMSKPGQIASLIAAAERELGTCDILVNNAGIQHVAPIEEFPDDKWDAIIAINLSAAFHATKAALPGMKKRRWGRIINIASAHGLVASAQKVGYVAAKHGLVGVTKVTAVECANDGITCNAICPGWVLTPLVERQLADRAQQTGRTMDQTKEDFLREKQPMLAFSTPESIGALTVFLCGDAAATITGSAYSIDGGWVAQ